MPRRPRVLVEGLTYHVGNRAGRGEAPFTLESEAGRSWLLPLLAYLAPLSNGVDTPGTEGDGPW